MFFSLPKQARLLLSCRLAASHSLLRHVPYSGFSLPILQGHLPSGPALLSDLLGSTGSLGSHGSSRLNQTFAGALDPQRRTGELLQAKNNFEKSGQRGNCFIHCTFTSLSYRAVEEKHSEAGSHLSPSATTLAPLFVDPCPSRAHARKPVLSLPALSLA